MRPHLRDSSQLLQLMLLLTSLIGRMCASQPRVSASHPMLPAGGSSRLSCHVGNANVTYIFWLFRASPTEPKAELAVCHITSNKCGLKPTFAGLASWNSSVSLSINGSLFISNVTREQDGQYVCVVLINTDSQSAAASITVLTQPQAPRIATAAAAATAAAGVAAGEQVNASCQSTGGNPVPQFVWQLRRRGQTQYQPLPGGRQLPLKEKFGTSASSVSFAVSPEDNEAALLCSIVHPAGNFTSNRVVLNVLYAPRMQSPASIRVVLGDAVTLNCSGDGNPQPSVHIEKNGERVSEVGIGRTSLRLREAAPAHAGNYSCRGSSSAGGGSSDTLLEVQQPPRVSAPASATVREGARLSVTCSVAAVPAASWIRWRRVGDSRPASNSSLLLLARAARTDAGQWMCEAANVLSPTAGPGRVATSRATTSVVVEYAPGQPEVAASSRTVLAGESVSLTCAASGVSPGVPEPSFEWRREPRGVALAAGQRLLLSPALLRHSGSYSCTPRNAVGEGPAGIVAIGVRQPPVWTEPPLPEEATATAGSEGYRLRCSASGEPPAAVRWLKDSRPLDERLYTVVALSDSASHTANSTLQFRGSGRSALLPQDNGKFECTAENSLGNISQSVRLAVKFPPVILTNVTKVALDPDAAQAALECPLLSLPAPTVTWEFSDASRVGNLVPDSVTPYKYRATMLEIRNPGDYSCLVRNELGAASHTFKVVRQSAPEPPSQLRAAAKAWDHVLLTWRPGFDGGQPASYWLRRLANGSSPSGVGARPVPAGAGHALNVTGLRPATNYTFRVFASNRRGNSSDSPALFVTTDSLSMPVVSNVYRAGEELLFASLPNYCLRVEVSKAVPTVWDLLHRCLPSGLGRVTNIDMMHSYRLSLCLRDRDSICGRSVTTGLLSEFPEVSTATIAIVACSCAFLILGLLVVLLFFCCRGRQPAAGDSVRQRSKQSSLEPDLTACTYKSYHSKPYAMVSPHPSLTSTDETSIEPSGKVFTTLLSASHPLPGNNSDASGSVELCDCGANDLDGSGSDNSGTFLHPSRQRKVIYEVVV